VVFVTLVKAAALALAVGLTLACGAAPTPEERVRATLAAIATAAQARDASAIKPHVSEAYADPHGNDRRALLGFATAELMRHQAVYLWLDVREVELADDGAARVDALVALAGSPIAEPGELARLHAELYRLDLRLRDEKGDYRLTSADWRPASLDDFR
jgi:hypothetical protein